MELFKKGTLAHHTELSHHSFHGEDCVPHEHYSEDYIPSVCLLCSIKNGA